MIRSAWIKSSYSTAGGSCVEVRRSEDGNIQVRDSKVPNGLVLTFTPTEWNTFIFGTRHDEFNL
ncbi:MAG TPA: DUF397 domain-containing protein [Micromonosporaceae bacterium]